MNFKINLTLITVSITALLSLFIYFQKQHYEHKLIEKERQHQQVLAEIRRDAEKAKQEQEKRIKQADEIHYKELKENEKIISNLRHSLNNGTVRLRQQARSHANADGNQLAPMGEAERAECQAGTAGVEQHILTLADYALTAIAQRDACVEMVGGAVSE